METKYYLLLAFLLIHLFFGVQYQKQILKSNILERNQKIINSILIWIIPFIWFSMLKAYINEDNPVVTKQVREKRRKAKKNGGFYESGKGIHGA